MKNLLKVFIMFMVIFCLPVVIYAADEWYSSAESSSGGTDYDGVISKEMARENAAGKTDTADFEQSINQKIDKITELRDINDSWTSRTVIETGGTSANASDPAPAIASNTLEHKEDPPADDSPPTPPLDNM